MNFLFFIIVLVFGCLILFGRGERRIELFFLAIIFVPSVIPYPANGINSHRFFVLLFWASVLLNNELVRYKKNTISLFLILILFSYYLTGINDNRLTLFSKFWKPTIHFITEYGLLVLFAATLFTKKKWDRFHKFIIKICFIVCGYGIITALIGVDPYSQGIAYILADKEGCDFTPLGNDRPRICSFLYNSHQYGYFCAVMTILLTYFYFKNIFSKKEKICYFTVISGLLLSGSRSSLIAALIGVLIIIILGVKFKKRFRYIIAFILILIPASQLAFIHRSLESVAVIFSDEGHKQTGSSIEMRQKQLAISMSFFSMNPLWGNGFDYYAEVVKPDDTVIKEQGLYGAESYIFILLIERGIIQIVTIFVFFIAFLVTLYRNRRVNRLESAVAMAIFLSFVSVSITTGNGGKWVFALPFVGIFCNTICSKF